MNPKAPKAPNGVNPKAPKAPNGVNPKAPNGAKENVVVTDPEFADVLDDPFALSALTL